MQKALQYNKNGTARVVPILMRPVDWKGAPFSHLQILPTEAKPVTRWVDRDDAFEDIAIRLREVVEELRVSLKTKEDWFEEGNALYDQKRYEEAIVAFDQAMRLDPNYADAYDNKGIALGNLKRYEEALIAHNKAIRHNPTSLAYAYYNKGVTLKNLKRYEEALVVFDQAIRLDPSYAVAYHNKGAMLQQINRRKEAQAAFEKAKQLGFSG